MADGDVRGGIGVELGRLDRVCERDARYRWICGGVSVSYHTLCDFRSLHVEFLGKLLVDSVSALIHQGVVPLDRSGLGLAALLVCCLPTLVFSDDIQYLPDNPQIIASIDFFGLFILLDHADMKANADKLQAVTMKMNDSGRLKMSVTLICNDPAGAGVIKSILNRSLKDFENLLNVRGSLALRQVGPLPSEAEYERIFTATRKMVSAMQVFSADNKVSASARARAGYRDARHLRFFRLWS